MKRLTERWLFLDKAFDFSPGQDGGPLWQIDDVDNRFLVGMVSREREGSTVAIRLNHELYGYLTAWLDGFDGPADLVPSDVSTDLGYELLRADQGTVTCRVKNKGDRRADTAVAAVRAEARARQRLAASHLKGARFRTHSDSHHGWLRLPEGWIGSTFIAHLRASNVALVDQETFAVGRVANATPSVRVSLGSVSSRAELSAVLKALNDALQLDPRRTLLYG